MKAGEAGLTLVETLIVLAIVAIGAGAAMLGLGVAARGDSAEAEANRLAATLQSAADDAMVSDRALALDWDAGGYRVTGAKRHALPGAIRLAGRTAGPVPIVAEGVPVAFRLSRPGDSWTVAFDGLRAAAFRSRPS